MELTCTRCWAKMDQNTGMCVCCKLCNGEYFDENEMETFIVEGIYLPVIANLSDIS